MTDVFLLLIRWLHAIAAVAWVGGGIFYWVVLRPASRAGEVPPTLARFAGVEFGHLVVLSMWTLVVTGGILVFTRLSEDTASVAYASVLAAKVALSAWLFFVAAGRRPRRGLDELKSPSRMRSAVNALGSVNTAVILGVVIFGLSDVLRFIVERELMS
ncbi:MAG: putative membrane protein [Chloroflexi bacterium]|jgi:uncharacterized membrane protein|nr:MAG: putative membrane protein [Chloroflexota bacterium]